jgi:hypothetical protein
MVTKFPSTHIAATYGKNKPGTFSPISVEKRLDPANHGLGSSQLSLGHEVVGLYPFRISVFFVIRLSTARNGLSAFALFTYLRKYLKGVTLKTRIRYIATSESGAVIG